MHELEDSQLEDSHLDDSQSDDSQPEDSHLDDSHLEDSHLDDSQSDDSQLEIDSNHNNIYTSEKMNDINNFYKLKRKYQIRMNKIKMEILGEKKKSMADKRRDWTNAKRNKLKCVNCNKKGGTYFSVKNRHLIAKCGNNQDPCKLNIDIKLEEVFDINWWYKRKDVITELYKQKIIKINLDMLFGFENKQNTLIKFNKEKDELKEDIGASSNADSLYDMYTKLYNNQNNIKKLNNLSLEYEEIISEIKDILLVREDDHDIGNKVKEAIDLQMNLPNIIDKISKIKYDFYKMEDELGVNNLIIREVSIYRTEF